MAKVLICTVGGEPKPIVNAIEQNGAVDRVYFLCSTGARDRASDVTIEEVTTRKVTGHCPRCEKGYTAKTKVRPIAEVAGLSPEQYAIERVADPDDLVEVVAACRRIDDDLRLRWPGESVEVVANYTGGAKTMSLGLGTYALRKGPPWWLQLNRVLDNRPNLTRIEAGDMALRQDVSHLLAETAAERATKLADRHDYTGAGAVLDAVLTRERLDGEDRERLFRQRLRCSFHAAWDRLDYAQALELARQDGELASEHAGRLNELIRVVTQLRGSEPWPGSRLTGLALVEDLRANAERAAARGRFDDAVGRLYRATELLAQLKLRRDYGIRTGDVDLEHPKIPEKAKARLERERLPGKTLRIGLLAAYDLLADLGDPLGLYFAGRRGSLLNVLEKRNQSLFAHGLTPVDRETWNTLAPAWRAWLDGAQEACR